MKVSRAPHCPQDSYSGRATKDHHLMMDFASYKEVRSQAQVNATRPDCIDSAAVNLDPGSWTEPVR